MLTTLLIAALQAAAVSQPAAAPITSQQLFQRCQDATAPAERSQACVTLDAARRASRIKFLVFTGRAREAETEASQALALHPGPVGTALVLAARAEARAADGRLAEAEQDLNEMLRTSTIPVFDTASALSLRASIKARRGDVAGAGADHNAAVATDPASAEVRSDRGSFLEARGRYDEALVDFTAATQINPTWANGFNNLCFVLAAYLRHDLERAQIACDRAILLDPTEAAFHDSAGLLAMRRGRWSEALTRYERAVQLAPTEAVYLYGRGIARLRTGQAAEGREDIAASTRMDAEVARTWARFGITP